MGPRRGARGCPAQAEVGVAGDWGSQALRVAALAVGAGRGAAERAQREGPAQGGSGPGRAEASRAEPEERAGARGSAPVPWACALQPGSPPPAWARPPAPAPASCLTDTEGRGRPRGPMAATHWAARPDRWALT